MNTIRKVMMVVAVLITSCQVSEKPKSGPVAPQTTTPASASMKAPGLPASSDTPWAKAVNLRWMSAIFVLP
jgi:hypothetical protein